jgi:hypothetical protein
LKDELKLPATMTASSQRSVRPIRTSAKRGTEARLYIKPHPRAQYERGKGSRGQRRKKLKSSRHNSEARKKDAVGRGICGLCWLESARSTECDYLERPFALFRLLPFVVATAHDLRAT